VCYEIGSNGAESALGGPLNSGKEGLAQPLETPRHTEAWLNSRFALSEMTVATNGAAGAAESGDGSGGRGGPPRGSGKFR
jgi:hypothetical protein